MVYQWIFPFNIHSSSNRQSKIQDQCYLQIFTLRSSRERIVFLTTCTTGKRITQLAGIHNNFLLHVWNCSYRKESTLQRTLRTALLLWWTPIAAIFSIARVWYNLQKEARACIQKWIHNASELGFYVISKCKVQNPNENFKAVFGVSSKTTGSC